MSGLYTVGYESVDLQTFLACLLEHRIEILLDVRDYPLSRKKGFSKKALAEALTEVGIDYEHWQQLGAPKLLRHRLRETENWNEYVEGYSEILEVQEQALADLAAKAHTNVVCLMCFERDHRECHRSLVAERLQSLALIDSAMHLTPKTARLASAA